MNSPPAHVERRTPPDEVLPARTGICVSGRGNPASCSHSRIRLSRGDSAPPSTSGSSSGAGARPRARGYRSAVDTSCDRVRLVPHQRVQPSQRVRSVEVGAPNIWIRIKRVDPGGQRGQSGFEVISSSETRSVRGMSPAVRRPGDLIFASGPPAGQSVLRTDIHSDELDRLSGRPTAPVQRPRPRTTPPCAVMPATPRSLDHAATGRRPCGCTHRDTDGPYQRRELVTGYHGRPRLPHRRE